MTILPQGQAMGLTTRTILAVLTTMPILAARAIPIAILATIPTRTLILRVLGIRAATITILILTTTGPVPNARREMSMLKRTFI